MNQELLALRAKILAHPEEWRPLVLTNGCFDLLHVGHTRYLQSARNLGKSLVVGVNSDRSVQALKGHTRPIVPQEQRAELLLSLRSVSAVVIFEELTADHLIEALAPDFYAKGGDYSPETLPEMPTLRRHHTQLALIKVEIPTSTSAIVRKIKSAYQDL
jgi:rfaE bifunctional protein nucleotidyltransferase chain/domain